MNIFQFLIVALSVVVGGVIAFHMIDVAQSAKRDLLQTVVPPKVSNPPGQLEISITDKTTGQ